MKKCEGSQELDTGVKGNKAEIKRSIGMRDTQSKWRREEME
jgi:hypothetical protein